MSKKNDIFRVKIDFEEIPITDQRVKGVKGFDDLIEGIREKFGGRKR